MVDHYSEWNGLRENHGKPRGNHRCAHRIWVLACSSVNFPVNQSIDTPYHMHHIILRDTSWIAPGHRTFAMTPGLEFFDVLLVDPFSDMSGSTKKESQALDGE